MYTNKFQGERMVEYTKEMTQVSKKNQIPACPLGKQLSHFTYLGPVLSAKLEQISLTQLFTFGNLLFIVLN